MDYLRRLQERLRVAHEFTRQAQASLGVRQKRTYDTRCRGQDLAPGDRVWIYCPSRTKGVSPKLRSHWQGPGEVRQRLREVVYRVRRPGRGSVVVLHRDQLAPYRPLAQPAVEAADEVLVPRSPRDSPGAPGGTPKRTQRRWRGPPYLKDFLIAGDG
ncbi:hypothetical protein AAFF_G00144090 [Aldrovandia affinis]|uniref:Uncharacterized protein n=1 Tax=Aldrovandia affinis TaxID=143900 RepID=A0AAD7T0G4_9TELE|nr:hypothetical protein AAFF_G00144090 [Aldrovandia affinis]